MAAKFFRYPFAVSGDRLAIPDPTQGDGYVSYQQGFGPDYEKNLVADPAAKPISRSSFNEILFETTLAIQQYQTMGFPDFITSADNGGTPYLYDIYAIVRYNPGSGVQLYQSIISNNDQLPTNTSAWNQISLINSANRYAKIINTTTQNFPVSADTEINFPTIYKDPFGYVIGNGFKLPSGVWEFNISIHFSNAPGSSGFVILEIFKNGVLLSQLTFDEIGEVYTLAGIQKFSAVDDDIFTCKVNLAGSGTFTGHYAIFEVRYVGE